VHLFHPLIISDYQKDQKLHISAAKISPLSGIKTCQIVQKKTKKQKKTTGNCLNIAADSVAPTESIN